MIVYMSQRGYGEREQHASPQSIDPPFRRMALPGKRPDMLDTGTRRQAGARATKPRLPGRRPTPQKKRGGAGANKTPASRRRYEERVVRMESMAEKAEESSAGVL